MPEKICHVNFGMLFFLTIYLQNRALQFSPCSPALAIQPGLFSKPVVSVIYIYRYTYTLHDVDIPYQCTVSYHVLYQRTVPVPYQCPYKCKQGSSTASIIHIYIHILRYLFLSRNPSLFVCVCISDLRS